ncbi:MAG: zinc ribbon domain-containing protein [Candidatus Eremiobacterota bacterium]
MICPRCGQLNEDNASSCESCYTPLDSDTTITDIQPAEENNPYDISKKDRTTNSLAAGGMLLGIGSVLTCCTSPLTGLYIPGILGFTGLMMTFFGRKQIKDNPDTQGGKELTTIGIIFNGLSLTGSIITLISWLLGLKLLENLLEYLPR